MKRKYRICRRKKFRLSPPMEYVVCVLCILLTGFSLKCAEACGGYDEELPIVIEIRGVR